MINPKKLADKEGDDSDDRNANSIYYRQASNVSLPSTKHANAITTKKALASIFFISFLIMGSFDVVLAYAQEDNNPETPKTPPTYPDKFNQRHLDTTSSKVPVLEKVSDRGIFKVQLRWNKYPINPSGSINLEIFFLNASAPATLPSENPGVLPLVPVKSYDIAIYSANTGAELWKETDQPGIGGRGANRITFANQYTGPISINITDIEPGWSVANATTAATTIAGADKVEDSVMFTATVAPEFQLIAAFPFAIGIVMVIVIMRSKTKWTSAKTRIA